ncbi:hypothetical protein ACLOJK_032769, partial [Asimina triloba]
MPATALHYQQRNLWTYHVVVRKKKNKESEYRKGDRIGGKPFRVYDTGRPKKFGMRVNDQDIGSRMCHFSHSYGRSRMNVVKNLLK